MKNLFRFLLCFLSLTGAMSGSQKVAHDSAKQAKTADACKLLTRANIQAVQGEAVQETKPSTQSGGGIVMSQCLLRTANSSKSVSVAIASAGSASPRAFWQQQFGSGQAASDEKTEKKTAAGHRVEKEEDEESTRPRTIKGLGEQAYWVGSPMVGALYVLKGDTFLRISVGGVREESARIEKSVALARLALKRL
jgi:CCR4-NOT transcriptional regulation complex NOT5 subunit